MKRTSLKLTHEADAGLRKLRSDAVRIYKWTKKVIKERRN